MPQNKALEKKDVDKILSALMPAHLSDTIKQSIIDDQNLRTKNTSFDHNYKQMVDCGSTMDITQDYASFITYLIQAAKAVRASLDT